MGEITSKYLPAQRLDEAAQQIAERKLNPYAFAAELAGELIPSDD